MKPFNLGADPAQNGSHFCISITLL